MTGSVVFSRDRLRRLADAMNRGVEKGEIPGAVVAIGQDSEMAFLEAFGFRDREAGAPMRDHAIFRIASMTKPLTSLAAMMLVEEGALYLSDPASEYLPALKSLKVGVEHSNGKLDWTPCRNEPTILDLMRHTSGLTYGWLGTSAVKRLQRASGLDQFTGTASQYIAAVAAMPLQFQPGSAWGYSISTDVLGHVVEAVSQRTLAEFVAARITEPLRMTDTGFWVEDGKRDRIAEPQIDPATGKRPPLADRARRPPRFGGGGGMVSTVADYARFCRFWLNGGALDGARLISRKTTELMTADHLPPNLGGEAECAAFYGATVPVSANGQGFGLGFAVRVGAGRAPWHGSVGDFGWMGSSGCVFWIDPRERFYAILLTQAPTQLDRYRFMMRSLVYQAVFD